MLFNKDNGACFKRESSDGIVMSDSHSEDPLGPLLLLDVAPEHPAAVDTADMFASWQVTCADILAIILELCLMLPHCYYSQIYSRIIIASLVGVWHNCTHDALNEKAGYKRRGPGRK